MVLHNIIPKHCRTLPIYTQRSKIHNIKVGESNMYTFKGLNGDTNLNWLIQYEEEPEPNIDKTDAEPWNLKVYIRHSQKVQIKIKKW